MARVVENIAFQRRGAHSVTIEFDDKDFRAFVEALKTLPDKLKRTEINGLIRQQAKPVLIALRNATPVRKRRGTGKYGQIRGNLRDSMVIGTRKAGKLGVWVGPKTNKFQWDKNATSEENLKRNLGKKDGYYGFWIERGTKEIAGKFFMERTMEIMAPFVSNQMSKGVKDYIVREFKKGLGK